MSVRVPIEYVLQGHTWNGVTVPERLRKDVDFPWPDPDTPIFFHQNLGQEEIVEWDVVLELVRFLNIRVFVDAHHHREQDRSFEC
jgi:hypothetical protein